MSRLRDRLKVSTQKTTTTVVRRSLVIDRAMLEELLEEALDGAEGCVEGVSIKVVGIPYQEDWELDEGDAGVHLVASWEQKEITEE